PALVDVRGWTRARSKCDEAAAAYYDPDRRAPGLMLEHIVADIAVAACAVRETNGSEEARATYQYGRALLARGKPPAARQAFEDAVRAGYPSARIDLAAQLVQSAAAPGDIARAVSLYQQAWGDGIAIAAFDLGKLYEHGMSRAGGHGYLLTPDPSLAWSWYRKGVSAAEPDALAHFGERAEVAASSADPARQSAYLLEAFKYYAAAAERARREDWPDEAWRTWRYHRASLARILARAGMMQEVAAAFEAVRVQ
ncbi:MAG TPA: hypothetical protein VNU73_06510, partial [Steroidobacteraceae bacterium]|nr:hypothetical protein [Steroidobacteraceae bacterium]